MPRCYSGFGPFRVRWYRIPSTRQLGEMVSLRRFYASVYDNNVPSLVASLFSWRCLAPSTSSFLHAAINLRPPSTRLSQPTRLPPTPSLPNRPLCQTPGCRSVRSGSTLSPSHPVLSALYPQGFRTRFALANRPSLIQISAPAHEKSLLLRNVVSMHSHTR